jgi:hypothetical protein
MILNTSSVDLEGITSSVSRSQFDESELEYLANLFLKSGDTVSPILLREKSPIAFEVLKGHREYYAAIKAQEIDPRFEAIRAYIVPSDRQDSVLEQYQYFRDSKAVAHPSNNSTDQNISISDIKRCISEEISPLKANLRDVNTKLDEKLTDPQIKDTKEPFSQSEQIDALVKAIGDLDKRIPKLPSPRPESYLLHDLNHQSRDQLMKQLAKADFKGATLQKLVDSIIETRPYTSFADLLTRKSTISKNNKFFSEKTLVKVLDTY